MTSETVLIKIYPNGVLSTISQTSKEQIMIPKCLKIHVGEMLRNNNFRTLIIDCLTGSDCSIEVRMYDFAIACISFRILRGKE